MKNVLIFYYYADYVCYMMHAHCPSETNFNLNYLCIIFSCKKYSVIKLIESHIF